MNAQKENPNTAYVAWKHWSAGVFCSHTRKDKIVYSAELRNAGVSVTPDSRILEIGFGNASFASYAMEKTRHYVGTELNNLLIDRALRHGIA